MSVNDILTFNTQVLFIVLSIFAFVDYARWRSARRRDFFLFAFALGLPLSITFLRRFIPLQSGLLDLAGAFALFSQPYFLFRLLQYFRPSRPKMGALILVGFLVCCIFLLTRMSVDPVLTVTLIFSYCAAAEAYTTWGFYQGIQDTSGTLHRRLTIITVSSGVFTIAFIINAVNAQFPGLGITPIAQAAAAVSAILFYMAFIPPRWMRRAWQMEELRGYIAQANTVSNNDNFVIVNLQRLCQSARQVTNGLAAGVLKADTLPAVRSTLAATDQDFFDRLSALDPSFIRQVWESRTPAHHVVSNIADPNQRQQLKTLGAQTWLLVPIQSQDHFWGILIVALRDRSLFIEDDLNILELLAQECVLIVENHRLIDELQDSLDRLKSTVEERQRITLALHDAVTQTLFSATITAESLPKLLQQDYERGVEKAKLLAVLTRAMMAELRNLLQELRPELLIKTSLSKLLQQLIDAARPRKNIEGRIVVEGSENDIPSEVRIAFFRISQECINNIVKHSDATAYTIHLHIEPQTAQLQVSDNGKGFDPRANGHSGSGLITVQERAKAIGATVSIQSQPHDGTTVLTVWEHEDKVAS